ncbi:MAG TPA: two-component regulator propeller domain-containing protein [Bacteroidia bacterium]|nr:two-component regulator propeller domain-containing protein [Bacteroidia bacterium]
MNLQKFSVKDGLIQSTVKYIEQDQYGNLWLGTNYGLSKFNGKTFENFTTTNGLPSNEISSLLFSNDILFIGTRKGFCAYTGSKIDSRDIYKKINGNVKKILEDKGVLHIITSRGYYLLDVTKPNYKLDSIAIPNITSQGPTDAEFDEDGNLWISTNKKGLFFIEKTISTKIPKFVLIQNSVASTTIKNKLVRIVNFNSSNLFKSDAIYSIEFDRRKNLLVSDWGNGLAEIKFDFINSAGFSANYLNLDSIVSGIDNILRFINIQKDDEGNIYLATDGFGYLKVPLDKNTNENTFNKREISWLSNGQGFFGNNPLCFKQDKFQNLWVGTLNDGLVVVNNKSSLSYNQKSGLEEEKVISVFKSSDSSIWTGTYGGGAFKYKNKKFTRCFWEQGISESIIKSICEDNNGNIILGTVGGGLSIISKENTSKQLQVTKAISETNNLSSNFVSYVYKASNGAIWVGFQGASKIDRVIINKDFTFSITSFPITELYSFNVSCILEDDENNIWITSNEGVWKLNPKTGYVNNENAIFKNVQTIAKDWNGNMWLGTSDVGTIILKNKLQVRYFEKGQTNTFEKIATKDGISSNCINTILMTENVVWFITNNGINELKIDTYLNKIKEIKSYNKGQGFASYDNKSNTAVFDDNGFIWIGSVEGLTQYQNINDNEKLASQIPVTVFINSILIENKQIDWTDSSLFSSGDYSALSFDGYYNWYKMPKDLKLDYTHNSIQFILNTDNIAEQKQMNYSYKLIGYDKDWIQLFSSNEITYRNLPSGDYSLVIKASLSNDFSNSKEYTYHFSITPPFWLTKTFYLFVGLCFIAFLYFFIVNREKRLKRDKQKLELQVKARTSEIENKKKEIELQNVLIQGINKDLTDSIKYAQRIQQTILPNTNVLSDYFSDYCLFYKPRNIVSGDYYWIKEINDLIYVAVVDCTGHGVPGAFMSLISSSILNESVDENISHHSPAKMLEFLRREINIRLSQNADGQINDGLDIALICYNKTKSTIEYVNANRPLYIISNDELITLTSENVNIGGYADFDSVIPTKTITLKKDDLLFLFTDGITDQFGGDRNKKYNPARLRQFLLMNNHLSLPELKEKLTKEISDWQSSYEQTDDILFIGLKV